MSIDNAFLVKNLVLNITIHGQYQICTNVNSLIYIPPKIIRNVTHLSNNILIIPDKRIQKLELIFREFVNLVS